MYIQTRYLTGENPIRRCHSSKCIRTLSTILKNVNTNVIKVKIIAKFAFFRGLNCRKLNENPIVYIIFIKEKKLFHKCKFIMLKKSPGGKIIKIGEHDIKLLKSSAQSWQERITKTFKTHHKNTTYNKKCLSIATKQWHSRK